jgi:hypothetical protein
MSLTVIAIGRTTARTREDHVEWAISLVFFLFFASSELIVDRGRVGAAMPVAAEVLPCISDYVKVVEIQLDCKGGYLEHVDRYCLSFAGAK